MGEPIQLYLNVDRSGFVKGVYSGRNIVAAEQYHYFFIVDQKVADNVNQYKVEVENMIPILVLRNDF